VGDEQRREPRLPIQQTGTVIALAGDRSSAAPEP